MTAPFTFFANLAEEIEPPSDGTLSRTIYQDDRLKAVLFGFSPGQELSEHTSSKPAVLYFLRGEAEVGLGTETMLVGSGAWIHMPAMLPHRIRANTAVTMLLLLLKEAEV